MAYTLPTFNLQCYVWNLDIDNLVDPPTFEASCQLYYPRQSPVWHYNTEPADPPAFFYRTMLYIRLPKLTDVRFNPASWTDVKTVIECPKESGRFYAVVQVDDAHKGFDNEYRVALVCPYPPWPDVIP